MDEVYQELIRTYAAESLDFLDEAEPLLVRLAQCEESGCDCAEETNTIFRLFHTIKGNSQAFQFETISRLAHHAEGLLSAVRNGHASLGAGEADVLCRVTDLLRRILNALLEGVLDSHFHDEAESLIALLTELTSHVPAPEASGMKFEDGICWVTEPPVDAPSGPTTTSATTELRQMFVQEGMETLDLVERALIACLDAPEEQKKKHISESFRAIHSLKGNCGFMGFAQLGKFCHSLESSLEGLSQSSVPPTKESLDTLLGATDAIRRTLRRLDEGGGDTVAGAEEIENKLAPRCSPPGPGAAGGGNAAPGAKEAHGRAPRHDVRVDLRKLDSLVDLVGEIVIAEAMLTGNAAVRQLGDESFQRASHQLRRIILELQDVAMAVRMVPVSHAFQKMIRIVHDVSGKTKKKVRLEMQGEDTEVDRTLVEKISDPLVHAIRNAIDHGIEPPEQRRACGKDETGRLLLEAGNDSGEIWIRITDDGRGLDVERIKARALERGLRRADELESATVEEIHALIFEPGFSTAEALTDISGRGIGMDVVRRNIADLKGHVRLQSRKGEGTTISIHIPLTLAVIEGMLVRVGNAKYTLPLQTIQESLRPQKSQITHGPDGLELVNIRSELVPVVRLHALYAIPSEHQDLDKGICVVVDAPDKRFALFVDSVLGQQQAVVKALPPQMMGVRTVSGCTILGTGEVSLIVDVPGVSAQLKQSFEKHTGSHS